jgi:hypothetical protein
MRREGGGRRTSLAYTENFYAPSDTHLRMLSFARAQQLSRARIVAAARPASSSVSLAWEKEAPITTRAADPPAALVVSDHGQVYDTPTEEAKRAARKSRQWAIKFISPIATCLTDSLARSDRDSLPADDEAGCSAGLPLFFGDAAGPVLPARSKGWR